MFHGSCSLVASHPHSAVWVFSLASRHLPLCTRDSHNVSKRGDHDASSWEMWAKRGTCNWYKISTAALPVCHVHELNYIHWHICIYCCFEIKLLWQMSHQNICIFDIKYNLIISIRHYSTGIGFDNSPAVPPQIWIKKNTYKNKGILFCMAVWSLASLKLLRDPFSAKCDVDVCGLRMEMIPANHQLWYWIPSSPWKVVDPLSSFHHSRAIDFTGGIPTSCRSQWGKKCSRERSNH